MSEQSTGGTDRETVYVEEPPRRIFGNLLIDGCDGQCAYIYAGIEERCPNDAVAHTFLSSGKKVEMCAEHAREDVSESPKTEQRELVTDGGTVEDGNERPTHREKGAKFIPLLGVVETVHHFRWNDVNDWRFFHHAESHVSAEGYDV